MALPKLKDYYYAAQIGTLVYLCDLQVDENTKGRICRPTYIGNNGRQNHVVGLTNKNNPLKKNITYITLVCI